MRNQCLLYEQTSEIEIAHCFYLNCLTALLVNRFVDSKNVRDIANFQLEIKMLRFSIHIKICQTILRKLS